jgi:hypothetical protein
MLVALVIFIVMFASSEPLVRLTTIALREPQACHLRMSSSSFILFFIFLPGQNVSLKWRWSSHRRGSPKDEVDTVKQLARRSWEVRISILPSRQGALVLEFAEFSGKWLSPDMAAS